MGQPPSLNISSVGTTSALATITPPPGGCTPVSYVVSHARARTLDAPARTAVPAAGTRTARLGNLAAGVEYEATAVGVCADGTATPPSAPVRFTASAPPPPSDLPTLAQKFWAEDTESSCYNGCYVGCVAMRPTVPPCAPRRSAAAAHRPRRPPGLNLNRPPLRLPP